MNAIPYADRYIVRHIAARMRAGEVLEPLNSETERLIELARALNKNAAPERA